MEGIISLLIVALLNETLTETKNEIIEIKHEISKGSDKQ